MKELETTQELVLLREAIELARKQGQHFLCGPTEIAAISACAQSVADASEEINMLLTVDGRERQIKEDAQKTMHLVLFQKTLVTSDDHDESCLAYFEHVLTTIPVIGWPVYVECLRLCDWLPFAMECWMASSSSQQIAISKRILQSFSHLSDAKMVKMWQWTFSTLFKFVLSSSNASSSLEEQAIKTGLQHVVLAEDSSVKAQAATHLVDTIKLWVISLEPRNMGAVIEIILPICECLLTVVSSEDVRKLLIPSFNISWGNCLSRIYDVSSAVESTSEHVVLKDVIAQLKRLTVVEESREEQLHQAIRTVSETSNCSNETKDVLLNRLEEEFLPNIIECLLDPSVSLNPIDTLRLVRLALKAPENEAAQFRQAIFQAFNCWPIVTQNDFRRECHMLGAQIGGTLIDANFHKSLTETMNKMSLNKENEVTRDLSLLCLQSPSITIDALIAYSSECGQSSIIAEILSNMKSSCNFVEHGNISILVTYLKKVLEENDQSNKILNILSLLKELIICDALPMSDILSQCVYADTVPSPKLIRTLKIMKAILSTATDDTISVHVRPAAFLALLANSLHHCMHVNLATVGYDVHNLKQETLIVIRILLRKILKDKLLLDRNDVHWLWTKNLTLNKIVSFIFHPLFLKYGLESVALKHRGLPLDQVLVALSMSRPNQEIDVNLLSEVDNRELIPHVVTSLTKVLPRLIMEEIGNLLVNLSKCIARYLTSLPENEANVRPLSKITSSIMFLNSLVWLCARAKGIDNSHLIQTIHFCGTAIRNLVTNEPDLSIPDLTALTYVAGHLTECLPDETGAVGRLLILDLLNQIQTLKTDASLIVVNVLKDLVARPSNDELHSHITKLVEQLCAE